MYDDYAEWSDEKFAAFGLASVDVVEQPFEETELPEGAFRLPVSATAFHWIEQERGMTNIARVLRRGGWWAAWWSGHHDPANPDPLYHALEPIFERLPSSLGPSLGPSPFDVDVYLAEMRKTGTFRQIAAEEIRTTLSLDPTRARTLFGTFSPLLAIEAPERERILDEIEQLIASDFGGLVERTSLTVLYTAQRT